MKHTFDASDPDDEPTPVLRFYSPAHRRQWARERRAEGMLLREIAAHLGVTKQRVTAILGHREAAPRPRIDHKDRASKLSDLLLEDKSRTSIAELARVAGIGHFQAWDSLRRAGYKDYVLLVCRNRRKAARSLRKG